VSPRLLISFTAALAGLASPAAAQERWVVRAAAVYTAAGDPIENGTVVVSGAKITAVGGGGGPGGEDETLEVAAVTPGLIDLSVRIGATDFSVEQSTETAIEVPVVRALDLFSPRWESVLESGVTTVLASPLDMDVFGGLGVVLKTGGPPTLESRRVLADACLRASLGPQPSAGNAAPRGTPPIDMYYRRPTTRMGVEWVMRKAYSDLRNADRANRSLDGREAERQAILRRTLEGDLPLFVQARGTQDVHTAVFLKEEFGIPRMVLDASAESWMEPELLRRSGVGVVFPPFSPTGRIADGFVNDAYFLPWGAPARLHELGVPIALSAHGASLPGESLAHQAGFAMRGGLPFEAVLEAVTIAPARMIGVDERVGSLEVGKDADLVLWNGKPFEASSGIVGVILGGRLVVDPRR
jgi:imidazolonepropionase-like amidohydrolase